MKKILMFQWFDCPDAARAAEFLSCAQHNLQLGFDEIVIWNDSTEARFSGPNITNICTDRRMTYRAFIDAVNDPANLGSLVVLTNSDIKLADNFGRVAEAARAGDFLCFTRYEGAGQLAQHPWCTQDVWAMVAQPVHNSVIYQSDIPLGMPGCEIRFAEIMFSAGFSVFNPCLEVRNLHLHSNQVPHREENRIFGAYLFTPACSLTEVRERALTAQPTPCYLTKSLNRVLTMH